VKQLVRFGLMYLSICPRPHRPLDRKMTYQVDKMLKVAASGGENLDASLQYAPNPDQLVGQDGQDDDDDQTGEGSSAKDGIYRAPRLAAVHYEEEEREDIKKAKRDERNRKRLQKSAILSELREEFSERPTEILASGSSVLDKEIAKDEAEKRDFEESRFVRVVTSRKDKIRKRQRESEAMRAGDMDAIDNFAAVQDILSLDKSKHRIPTGSFGQSKAASNGKTGGIFAHIDVPTEKKRKVGRGANNHSSSSAAARAATSAPFGGGKATSAPAESSSKSAGGKKKKVVFSSIF
jgi:U3 small nucleolar ribonucleoprotein protein LCP5